MLPDKLVGCNYHEGHQDTRARVTSLVIQLLARVAIGSHAEVDGFQGGVSMLREEEEVAGLHIPADAINLSNSTTAW